MNQAIAAAFSEELEKISGLPSAVRKGKGGTWGLWRRHKAALGKDIKRRTKPGTYRRKTDLPKLQELSKKKKTVGLSGDEQAHYDYLIQSLAGRNTGW